MDDRELLLRTHRGCERSALALWSSHAPKLLVFAAAIVGKGDAEDVVQAVFCGLLDLPRSRITEIRDVPAFLAASTRRAALNSLRLARREQARREATARTRGLTGPAPEGIGEALDRLPRRQREVVVLKHVSGLTFDQMGTALGVPRDTAASRYRAAMAVLRRLLGVEEDGFRVKEVAHAW